MLFNAYAVIGWGKTNFWGSGLHLPQQNVDRYELSSTISLRSYFWNVLILLLFTESVVLAHHCNKDWPTKHVWLTTTTQLKIAQYKLWIKHVNTWRSFVSDLQNTTKRVDELSICQHVLFYIGFSLRKTFHKLMLSNKLRVDPQGLSRRQWARRGGGVRRTRKTFLPPLKE